MRGLFVTGTDTGVGKSVLSAALLAAMTAAGEAVRAYKPVLTGLEEPGTEGWPRDDELLGAAAGMAPDLVAPLRFGPAVSPHLAAELAGVSIDPDALVAAAGPPPGEPPQTEEILVVEGVGGLMVPLSGRFLVRDLAARIGLPLLIAARPGLGTISHTLLTLEAARAGGLQVAAVVLTPWPEAPGVLERSNLATIERLGGVEVSVLGTIASPQRARLAEAGAALPWRRWCEPATQG
ncbi:MAG: dethiobiotin synthase [Solirubrobacteraceae bacterium]